MLVGRKVSQESGMTFIAISSADDIGTASENRFLALLGMTKSVGIVISTEGRNRTLGASRNACCPRALASAFAPLKKSPERLPAMAVSGLLLCRQFRKCFLNRRKIKQRIVSETILPARRVKNHAFGLAMKHSERLAIPRRSNDANKSPCPFFSRDASNLANHPCIIFFIIGIELRLMRFLGGIPR